MAEPVIVWSEILADLCPRLHAADASTLQWWTEADLRGWANEALLQLGRGALLFVRRYQFGNTTPGDRLYPLPDRHLVTIHVTYADTPLSGTDYALIDALDYGADGAMCGSGESPTRWYEDGFAPHQYVALYPTPSAAETLDCIYTEYPALLLDANSTVPIPQCMKAFVEDAVLAEAWGHDSDFSMPELAEHLRAKRSMYLDIYQSYWGQKQ